MNKKLTWLLAIVLFTTSSVLSPVRPAQAETYYDGNSAIEQQKALDYVNRLRVNMGLNKVTLDPFLTKAANNHAEYANEHYTIKSGGNLSEEVSGQKFYTQSTPAARAAAAGYPIENRLILETVYMKERAYDQFDMGYEMYELSLVHSRREVMLNPEATALGIARVGKSTVIVAAVAKKADPALSEIAVYPYDGMMDTWSGYMEVKDATKLMQDGEGATISVYIPDLEVTDFKASLTTQTDKHNISIPLSVKKMETGCGYVLTAQRQLHGDRLYTGQVSYQIGGETVSKEWAFRTDRFLYPLYIDDMPLMFAPALNNVNGRIEVPMRYLFELFGATVHWDKNELTITATKQDLSLKMKVGSDTAYINDKAVQLDSPPRLNLYTTYVPLRFVSEAFGYEVEYIPDNGGTVEIWTGLLDS